MKNETPIQIIKLGGSHTVVINNKNKAFSWGWNNYGQCGHPCYCKYINFKITLF